MYRTIYSVLLTVSIIMLVDFVFLTKIFLRMEYMLRPEHSALVESYKEGYRYVVKDVHEKKLIFFE